MPLGADAWSIAEVGPGGAPDWHNPFHCNPRFPQAISQHESWGLSFPPGLCTGDMSVHMRGEKARNWGALRTLELLQTLWPYSNFLPFSNHLPRTRCITPEAFHSPVCKWLRSQGFNISLKFDGRVAVCLGGILKDYLILLEPLYSALSFFLPPLFHALLFQVQTASIAFDILAPYLPSLSNTRFSGVETWSLRCAGDVRLSQCGLCSMMDTAVMRISRWVFISLLFCHLSRSHGLKLSISKSLHLRVKIAEPDLLSSQFCENEVQVSDPCAGLKVRGIH